ncbi:interferon-induced transmembrane protein 1-like [Hyperolius riggenbachi]|uniref:interferon-induced transmembrane protein 1-like n=1 Tax=Hyperolius riggenbachi TaxID=752182 RepID=UPI0035A32FA0
MSATNQQLFSFPCDMESTDKVSPTQQLLSESAKISKEDRVEKVEMTPVDSAVVTITSEQLPVKDHIIWSIFNTIYMNCCCLGFLALLFSVKSRDQKLNGNQSQARKHSITARYLNIFSMGLTILWFSITVAVIIYNLYQVKMAIRSWLGL